MDNPIYLINIPLFQTCTRYAVFYTKDRTMDNVQNCDSYSKAPLSQTNLSATLLEFPLKEALSYVHRVRRNPLTCCIVFNIIQSVSISDSDVRCCVHYRKFLAAVINL
jgi:hypothetical protein